MHQIAVGKDEALASAPTLSRFENAQTRQSALSVNLELVDQFTASNHSAPLVVFLDFDATDTPVHGDQERRFSHGYYDCHCFLPLYVFCGDQLLVAYLRPSNADSGFCRNLLLRWCDRNDVKYIVGIACNSRLPVSALTTNGRAAPASFFANGGRGACRYISRAMQK